MQIQKLEEINECSAKESLLKDKQLFDIKKRLENTEAELKARREATACNPHSDILHSNHYSSSELHLEAKNEHRRPQHRQIDQQEGVSSHMSQTFDKFSGMTLEGKENVDSVSRKMGVSADSTIPRPSSRPRNSAFQMEGSKSWNTADEVLESLNYKLGQLKKIDANRNEQRSKREQ